MRKRHAQTLSIMQVAEMFRTEDQAVEWFEQVRWHGETDLSSVSWERADF